VKSAEEPQDLHKLFEQALNSGDLDALVALYALDGLLMARGEPARGIGAIRKALADYVAMKPTIPTHDTQSRANRRHRAACRRLAIPRNH
jgi:ketosteroid isomerase-like protein